MSLRSRSSPSWSLVLFLVALFDTTHGIASTAFVAGNLSKTSNQAGSATPQPVLDAIRQLRGLAEDHLCSKLVEKIDELHQLATHETCDEPVPLSPVPFVAQSRSATSIFWNANDICRGYSKWSSENVNALETAKAGGGRIRGKSCKRDLCENYVGGQYDVNNEICGGTGNKFFDNTQCCVLPSNPMQGKV